MGTTMAGREEIAVDIAQENEEKENIEDGEVEKSDRLLKLPISRIKNIVKMDPDVSLASTEAVKLIAKATELFIADLAKESYTQTVNGKRKTVQRKDMELAIDRVDELAFLEGAV